MTNKAIEVRNSTKNYGAGEKRVDALKGFHLDVFAGEKN